MPIVVPAMTAHANVQEPANDDATTISDIINEFEGAFYQHDITKLKRLAGMEGIYFSEIGKVVSGAELAKFADNVQRVREPWDEKTVPVVRIETVQHIAPNVRAVRACEFQPTMSHLRYTINLVLVSDGQEWRIVSLTRVSNCREKSSISGPIQGPK